MNTLTQFEYSALIIGHEQQADAVEEALSSSDVQSHVQRSFYLERVTYPGPGGLAEAAEEHADPRYQVIFVDATEPEEMETRVGMIGEFAKVCPASEIVVLISPSTEGQLVQLLQAGAWFFLEIPIQPAKLASILVRAVAFREANSLVRTDGLTGLYNRAFFEDTLRDQISQLQHGIGGQRAAAHPPVSLLVADLDNLQDTFGDQRDQREEFLREVGRAFHRGYRLTDIVARIGGDEFGVLLVGVNYSLALMRGEILRKKVLALPCSNEAAARPTLSVGVVTYPSFLDDPRQLYWYARRALGRAKMCGGNAVYGYDAHGTPMPFAELGS